MIKIKRLIALLNGANLTPETGLEKAVKTALAAINGKIDGSGPLYVEFTVDTSGETPVVTTEAVFADVAAAVAADRDVAAKVLLGEGQPTLYFPLMADAITALLFGGVLDMASSGEDPEPTLYGLTFTADGSQLTMEPLTAAQDDT